MRIKRTRGRIAGATLLVIVLASLLGVAVFRRPRLTPALRGFYLAGDLGCFACHGPGATGGVPNPGSEEEEVPPWNGGTAMMYVNNEQEIREWILYGRPERLAHEHDHEHAAGDGSGDRDHEAGDAPLLDMPAFEHIVSEREVDDLVAYYKAVAAYDKPPPLAKKGYRIATRLGCFGCHGPGGLVGSKNPRSFKGYIPPWRGPDYRDLARNEDELRAWILDGRIDRLESNPAARFFTGRQVIHMPAYRDVLGEGDLDAILAYIDWLQTGAD